MPLCSPAFFDIALSKAMVLNYTAQFRHLFISSNSLAWTVASILEKPFLAAITVILGVSIPKEWLYTNFQLFLSLIQI